METEWERHFRALFVDGRLNIFNNSVEPVEVPPYVNFYYKFWNYVMVENVSLSVSEKDFEDFVNMMKGYNIRWYKFTYDLYEERVMKYSLMGCDDPTEAELFANHIDGTCYFGFRLKAYVLGKRLYRIHHLEIQDNILVNTPTTSQITFEGIAFHECQGIQQKCECFGTVILYIMRSTSIPGEYNLEVHFERFYASYAAEIVLNGCIRNERYIRISTVENVHGESLLERSMYNNLPQ